MRHMLLGNLLALVLALVPVASTAALAQPWRAITEAENRIVLSGHQPGNYRALHHYSPFGESGSSPEEYRAQWKAGSVAFLSFRLICIYFLPATSTPPAGPFSLDRYTDDLGWFKDKLFGPLTAAPRGRLWGRPSSDLRGGQASLRSVVIHLGDGSIRNPDTLGNTRVNGFYCPVSGQVDAGTLESLLSRVGVRGIAVPTVEGPQVSSRQASQGPSADALATLVATGT